MSVSALYPGTFDPLTQGHQDIVRRSAPLFDRIVVAVAKAFHKNTLFDHEERLEMACAVFSDLPKVEVLPFNGLAVECACQNHCQTILRGLRAVSDFEYELQIANMNRHLNSSIETLFLTPDKKYTHLSSSLIREIFSLNGDISEFVHPVVFQALKRKVKNSQS